MKVTKIGTSSFTSEKIPYVTETFFPLREASGLFRSPGNTIWFQARGVLNNRSGRVIIAISSVVVSTIFYTLATFEPGAPEDEPRKIFFAERKHNNESSKPIIQVRAESTRQAPFDSEYLLYSLKEFIERIDDSFLETPEESSGETIPIIFDETEKNWIEFETENSEEEQEASIPIEEEIRREPASIEEALGEAQEPIIEEEEYPVPNSF